MLNKLFALLLYSAKIHFFIEMDKSIVFSWRFMVDCPRFFCGRISVSASESISVAYCNWLCVLQVVWFDFAEEWVCVFVFRLKPSNGFLFVFLQIGTFVSRM